ncbi:hypothetical protein Barb4_04768 [Bacteroidales bacterium Barb4]|nr:hypothetical protein Barb4_04768 [Bacteroidales bacterium Barb4]
MERSGMWGNGTSGYEMTPPMGFWKNDRIIYAANRSSSFVICIALSGLF